MSVNVLDFVEYATVIAVFFNLLHQALDGFILVITVDGEIFYASESVKDFLGYSQVWYLTIFLFMF